MSKKRIQLVISRDKKLEILKKQCIDLMTIHDKNVSALHELRLQAGDAKTIKEIDEILKILLI